MLSFYSDEELQRIGFLDLGRDVRVSRKSSIYGAERISIGDNSRVDDFCVISAGDGGIEIGRHVHVAIMCSLIGKERITIGDFANLSSRVAIYSSTDDFSGSAMTNPTVPAEYTNVESRPIVIGRHVIIGAGCVLLPGAHLKDGAALGALSLAKGVLDEFTIYTGVPARAIKERRRELLELEQRFVSSKR